MTTTMTDTTRGFLGVFLFFFSFLYLYFFFLFHLMLFIFTPVSYRTRPQKKDRTVVGPFAHPQLGRLEESRTIYDIYLDTEYTCILPGAVGQPSMAYHGRCP